MNQIQNIGIGIVLGAIVLGGVVIVPQLVENVDAHEVMVVQSPVDGTLTVYTDPGVKWQGFGKVTKYPRRAQYSFQAKGDSEVSGTSKPLRFNDGGHAFLSGAVQWEMPLKPEAIINIHKNFGNSESVVQQLIAKSIDAAVYLAGPLMSSTEASGERAGELVQSINDQAEHGVYVTRVVEKNVKDVVTGVSKQVTATEIVRDEKGNPRRQQGSALSEFGIKLLPLTITKLDFDKIVSEQIAQRQKATTEVQIAQAQAKKAEQDAITTEMKGKASATEAKWKQETIAAQATTEAKQKLDVATLDAKAAEQEKRAAILRGEGDAAKRQLAMSADGALDKKLEAVVEIQKAWADAYSKHTGNMVPQFVMGGNGTGQNSASAAQDLVQMLTAKTAKELSTDLSVAGKDGTAKKK